MPCQVVRRTLVAMTQVLDEARRAPLLDVRRIYLEPAVRDHPRGLEVLERFPDAEQVEVASAQRVPGLHDAPALVDRWVRTKVETLVLGVRKSMTTRPNGRSADFIGPGGSNGCAMACAYCYVPRRKGYANPITLYVNSERMVRYLQGHARRQGRKPQPDQVDAHAWVYDVGENGDCSLDARLCGSTRDLALVFRDRPPGDPPAKTSFATKHVNRELLTWDPRGSARVRFSLMPQEQSRLLDVRTTPVAERLAVLDEFVDAGWEVHVNLSPVVVREGWLEEWRGLLRDLDDATSARTKEQCAAEVILLTHNEGLHQVNLGWHPRAEDVLWTPEVQERKRSEYGQDNVRYRARWKQIWVQRFRDLVAAETPWLRIRYAF